ncbi:hypothetical protein D1007_13482 [Hordeum vulgare]|nr:hypothetical protein D1007_13482 [Hordeum vulgare]
MLAPVADGGVATKAEDCVAAAKVVASGVETTPAGDGVAATVVAGNHYRWATVAERVTNDPVIVENSINMLEQLLVEDDKYKVVSFDLEYTNGRSWHGQMVIVVLLGVFIHVLVYHYCLDTRPCEHFARFVNSPDYRYATLDTNNNIKGLKTSGLSRQKLVNIQCQYKVWAARRRGRSTP